MKQEFKPMSWLVKDFDCNGQAIVNYDVLRYREDFIKKLKKKSVTKEEFAEALRQEMMYYFWSKAEYELIIEIDKDNHIWLVPWCGCREPEKVRIDVTDDTSFDWRGFAAEHIKCQTYKNEAKIDVFDQLKWKWQEFVDYCWNYKHKWQRRKVNEI